MAVEQLPQIPFFLFLLCLSDIFFPLFFHIFCVHPRFHIHHINTAKMINTEPLIRVTVCVNRKKGTTEEEFNKYWAYEHGPLALDWLLRCGIVRYVQVSPA